MGGLTLDTGALIALERRRVRMLRVFRAAVVRELTITVPTPVLIEWWRGQRGREARDIVASVDIEPTTQSMAMAAGEALAATKRRNAVDAAVVASAAQRGDVVYTSDYDDLSALAAHFPGVRILKV